MYLPTGKIQRMFFKFTILVRGYTTTKTLTSSDGNGADQNTIRELLAHKQALLMELKHYDTNTKYNENIFYETESYENSGVIPASTRLEIAINTNDTDPKVRNQRMSIVFYYYQR